MYRQPIDGVLLWRLLGRVPVGTYKQGPVGLTRMICERFMSNMSTLCACKLTSARCVRRSQMRRNAILPHQQRATSTLQAHQVVLGSVWEACPQGTNS